MKLSNSIFGIHCDTYRIANVITKILTPILGTMSIIYMRVLKGFGVHLFPNYFVTSWIKCSFRVWSAKLQVSCSYILIYFRSLTELCKWKVKFLSIQLWTVLNFLLPQNKTSKVIHEHMMQTLGDKCLSPLTEEMVCQFLAWIFWDSVELFNSVNSWNCWSC